MHGRNLAGLFAGLIKAEGTAMLEHPRDLVDVAADATRRASITSAG
jgi:hypothetical protein